MFAILPVWRDFSYKFVGKTASGEFVMDFVVAKFFKKLPLVAGR